MRRRKSILFLIYTGILILTGAEFATRDSIDTKGAELERYQLEAQQLHSENERLRTEILKHTSLNYINDTARNAGFIDGTYYLLKR